MTDELIEDINSGDDISRTLGANLMVGLAIVGGFTVAKKMFGVVREVAYRATHR